MAGGGAAKPRADYDSTLTRLRPLLAFDLPNTFLYEPLDQGNGKTFVERELDGAFGSGEASESVLELVNNGRSGAAAMEFEPKAVAGATALQASSRLSMA